MLYNVNSQEPFEETKIWDRVCLKNILNFNLSMKYFTVAWPDLEKRILLFLHNISTQEPF